MSNNKYIPLPGGKECKRVNPYDHDGMDYLFYMYEAENHPTFPLTEVMPEGVEFEGEKIGQWYSIMMSEWKDIPVSLIDANKELGNETRIAIKPLKAKEPYWCETCGYDIIDGKCNCKAAEPSVDVVEKVKVNCLHAECPNCGHKVDVTPAEGTYIEKPIDVVENKETVEGLINEYQKLYDNSTDQKEHLLLYMFLDDLKSLKQSQSIEGIVGFVLEYIVGNTDGSLNEANEKEIQSIKSDIIKELNNGK